jgi:hypothetical protein
LLRCGGVVLTLARPRAQTKSMLAPSTGRIAKKKAKGFRMKKNGARPRRVCTRCRDSPGAASCAHAQCTPSLPLNTTTQ